MESMTIWAIIALISILTLRSASTWSQQSGSARTRPPARQPGPSLAEMCADGQNLYVKHGPWVYQFNATDLILKRKTQLPKPEPPEGLANYKVSPDEPQNT